MEPKQKCKGSCVSPSIAVRQHTVYSFSVEQHDLDRLLNEEPAMVEDIANARMVEGIRKMLRSERDKHKGFIYELHEDLGIPHDHE